MRVRWLRKALLNLDDEAVFIAADDPAAAALVVSRMLEAVEMLAEQPGIGRRPGRVSGTRELVVVKTRCIVPYRVRGEVVEALRVFHASRRLPQGW